MSINSINTASHVPISMFKMTNAGEYHSYARFVGCLDGLLIPNGTAGLDNRRNTMLRRRFNGIAERKKRIRCHNGTMGRLPRLFQRDISGADAIHLSSADAQCMMLIGNEYSI